MASGPLAPVRREVDHSSPKGTMISACSFLSTLVLLSELSGHLLTVAMPTAKDANDDGAMEEDGLGLILGNEAAVEAAAALPPYRRSNSLKDEDQRAKIIIVSVSHVRRSRPRVLAN